MKNKEEICRRLIRSVVSVVARDGMERTTVGSIAAEAGISQSALYRCYLNKDDLLRKTLLSEDEGFVDLVSELLPVLDDRSLAWQERCWRLWKPVWDFIIDPKEDCVFYIRYYYSENFRRHAKEDHERQFDCLRERLRPYFLPGRRDLVLLHQTFETMLSYAYRVMTGEFVNDEQLCHLALEQICNFLKPHFRPEWMETETL